MNKSKFKHVYPTGNGRWRVKVGESNGGTYNEETRAAHAADRLIERCEAESDSNIDRWTFNFPEEVPPYNVRRKRNALARGDWETLYGDDVSITPIEIPKKVPINPKASVSTPSRKENIETVKAMYERWATGPNAERFNEAFWGGWEHFYKMAAEVDFNFKYFTDQSIQATIDMYFASDES